MKLYASLGIRDYFLYDAEGLYLSSPIMGFTLVDGVYTPILESPNRRLHSTALGLDFSVGEVGLGIYDPVAGAWLQTPAESATTRADREATRAELQTIRADMAETRADQEASRADQEASRANQEAAARQRAEAELTELREELERLKARS